MSPKPGGPLFEVEWVHGDGDLAEVYTVDGLASEREADLVRDVFKIKEALDAGKPLDSLQLASPYGPPRLDVAAGTDAVRSAAGPKLTQQLQWCADEMGDPCGPQQRTLLHAAVDCQGCLAALVLLAAAAPSMAEEGDEHGRNPVYCAEEHRDVRVLRPLLTVAPGAAVAANAVGWTPLARIMERLPCLATLLLLEAVPAAAAAAGEDSVALLRRAAHQQGGGEPPTAPPAAATTATADGSTLLHYAARRSLPALKLLLAAGWGDAAAADHGGRTPLHLAAERCSVAAMQLLAAAAPAAATLADAEGCLPLHAAAKSGSLPAVRLLLQLAPGTAAAADEDGCTPAYHAAGHQDGAALEALLRAAPGTAARQSRDGSVPLHRAAEAGSPAAVRLLLRAAPATARARDGRGAEPLHLAAAADRRGEAVRLLLEAAPEAVGARTGDGDLPLQRAAEAGNLWAVYWMVTSAPQAGGWRDELRRLPVSYALWRLSHPTDDDQQKAAEAAGAASLLVGCGPTAEVAAALAAAGPLAQPLFADFVSARLPLSAAEWALVPCPCEALSRAFASALAHPAEQAGQLVRRLPPADAQRVRVAVLALSRAQRTAGCPLPQPILRRILASLFD